MKNKTFLKTLGIIIFVLGACALRMVTYASSAKEIALVYTGETHAMLYTCSCPIEKDGGIARRATLVKELRRKYPEMILVDSGDFFAGGLKDEYAQTPELDKKRTQVNLKAMELMKYDAAALSADEFNFGIPYLQDAVNSSKLVFLSANYKAEKIKPYLIKEVSSVKVGVVGVTPMAAAKKMENAQLSEPFEAVSAAVAGAKKEGAQVIILLSQLNPEENKKIASDITGVDVIISSYAGSEEKEGGTKYGNTLVLTPSWQGRKLGKVLLTVKDNKITATKGEDIPLSAKISDDRDIGAILPRCFQNSDCKKEGMIGTCQNPGDNEAACMFTEAHKVPVTVISSKSCTTCDTEIIPRALAAQIPGLSPVYLYYPQKEAKELVNKYKIKGLPAYLLSREVEKEKAFNSLKNNMELRGDYYILNPQVSGMSYFIDREKIKGSLDVFLSLFDPASKGLLDIIKDYKPKVHLLAVVSGEGFEAPKGEIEVEEDLRAVCVQKYYPEKFWDYLTCRAAKFTSTWWEDCTTGMDANKIRTCARGEEGKELLKENIALNKELQVMFGPVYLMDNQEIFASKGAPAKDELKKILKR